MTVLNFLCESFFVRFSNITVYQLFPSYGCSSLWAVTTRRSIWDRQEVLVIIELLLKEWVKVDLNDRLKKLGFPKIWFGDHFELIPFFTLLKQSKNNFYLFS